MKSLFRRWLGNPAPSFLFFLFLAGLCAVVDLTEPVSTGESEPFLYVCAALAFASAVQLLRVLWRRSRVLAILLGAGIPAFFTLAGRNPFALWGADRALGIILVWFPAALAVAVELTVRGVRRARGLPGIEASAAPRESHKAPGRKRGCLVGVVLLALFGGTFVMMLEAPRIASSVFKQRVRVGMTLGDVVVASFDTGRHLVFVKAVDGAPELQVYESTVRADGEAAEGETAVRALLERKAAELRVNSLSVMFVSSIPVSSSIVVRFGPDGRVTVIEGPFDRGD